MLSNPRGGGGGASRLSEETGWYFWVYVLVHLLQREFLRAGGGGVGALANPQPTDPSTHINGPKIEGHFQVNKPFLTSDPWRCVAFHHVQKPCLRAQEALNRVPRQRQGSLSHMNGFERPVSATFLNGQHLDCPYAVLATKGRPSLNGADGGRGRPALKGGIVWGVGLTNLCTRNSPKKFVFEKISLFPTLRILVVVGRWPKNSIAYQQDTSKREGEQSVNQLGSRKVI